MPELRGAGRGTAQARHDQKGSLACIAAWVVIPRITSELTQIFALFRPCCKTDARCGLATSSSGSPNDGRGSDLAIFPGIWTHSFCRLILNA